MTVQCHWHDFDISVPTLLLASRPMDWHNEVSRCRKLTSETKYGYIVAPQLIFIRKYFTPAVIPNCIFATILFFSWCYFSSGFVILKFETICSWIEVEGDSYKLSLTMPSSLCSRLVYDNVQSWRWIPTFLPSCLGSKVVRTQGTVRTPTYQRGNLQMRL